MPKQARASFDGPANDALTFICVAMGIAWLYLCVQNGLLKQLGAYAFGVLGVVWAVGFVARPMSR